MILPGFSAIRRHGPLDGSSIRKTGPLDEHRRARVSSLITPGSVWFFVVFPKLKGLSRGRVFQMGNSSRGLWLLSCRVSRKNPTRSAWRFSAEGRRSVLDSRTIISKRDKLLGCSLDMTYLFCDFSPVSLLIRYVLSF